MFILRFIGKILVNFVTRVIEGILFIFIIAMVGNNPGFFGNIAQYLVDGAKYVCSLLGFSWTALQAVGLTATLLTAFVGYVIVRFIMALIAQSMTGQLHKGPRPVPVKK